MSLTALLALTLLIAVLMLIGTALAWLARAPAKATTGDNEDAQKAQADAQLIERVNDVLPQTQCAQCGYPGCRPYARAIIEEHELINRCPPGGDRTIADLANLLGTPILALDQSCGDEKPAQVAVIDEEDCIGCTLCIHACPVDAIVGAAKLMHTVIGDECTGCELCLPPCPVDCIDLVAPDVTAANWQWPRPL